MTSTILLVGLVFLTSNSTVSVVIKITDMRDLNATVNDLLHEELNHINNSIVALIDLFKYIQISIDESPDFVGSAVDANQSEKQRSRYKLISSQLS